MEGCKRIETGEAKQPRLFDMWPGHALFHKFFPQARHQRLGDTVMTAAFDHTDPVKIGAVKMAAYFIYESSLSGTRMGWGYSDTLV